jgi:hypothetical protein
MWGFNSASDRSITRSEAQYKPQGIWGNPQLHNRTDLNRDTWQDTQARKSRLRIPGAIPMFRFDGPGTLSSFTCRSTASTETGTIPSQVQIPHKGRTEDSAMDDCDTEEWPETVGSEVHVKVEDGQGYLAPFDDEPIYVPPEVAARVKPEPDESFAEIYVRAESLTLKEDPNRDSWELPIYPGPAYIPTSPHYTIDSTTCYAASMAGMNEQSTTSDGATTESSSPSTQYAKTPSEPSRHSSDTSNESANSAAEIWRILRPELKGKLPEPEPEDPSDVRSLAPNKRKRDQGYDEDDDDGETRAFYKAISTFFHRPHPPKSVWKTPRLVVPEEPDELKEMRARCTDMPSLLGRPKPQEMNNPQLLYEARRARTALVQYQEDLKKVCSRYSKAEGNKMALRYSKLVYLYNGEVVRRVKAGAKDLEVVAIAEMHHDSEWV